MTYSYGLVGIAFSHRLKNVLVATPKIKSFYPFAQNRKLLIYITLFLILKTPKSVINSRFVLQNRPFCACYQTFALFKLL
jgi:hypothetical protein